MSEAYEIEHLEKEDRTVLKLQPFLAPYKVAILPLSKKLKELAMDVFKQLCDVCSCTYDETGSIGKRYRRQDAIGTPFCVTVDFDTQEDQCVTIRDRDTMEQVRIPLTELETYITKRIQL